MLSRYRTYQRCIRSATVELQIHLKKRAIQMCKALESLYNDRCERLKEGMSSGNYAEVGLLYVLYYIGLKQNHLYRFLFKSSHLLHQFLYELMYTATRHGLCTVHTSVSLNNLT